MKLAEVLQLREVPLTKHLINTDGNGIAEIQTAYIRHHRQTDTFLRMLQENLLRDAGIFSAENQVSIIGIGYVAVSMSCLCA